MLEDQKAEKTIIMQFTSLQAVACVVVIVFNHHIVIDVINVKFARNFSTTNITAFVSHYLYLSRVNREQIFFNFIFNFIS